MPAKNRNPCPLSCVNPVLLFFSPSLIGQEWAVVYCHWASTERSAKQGTGEWMAEREEVVEEEEERRRRKGGCCEMWNRRCTNHMGATAFQSGQIRCTIFLNITKTNYPGLWCMLLLLWKTIKLCKWLMPFHITILSPWISRFFFFNLHFMFKAKAIVLKKSPWCLSS